MGNVMALQPETITSEAEYIANRCQPVFTERGYESASDLIKRAMVEAFCAGMARYAHWPNPGHRTLTYEIREVHKANGLERPQ